MAQLKATPGVLADDDIVLAALDVPITLPGNGYEEGLVSAPASMAPVNVIIPWNEKFDAQDLLKLSWNGRVLEETEYEISDDDVAAEGPLTLELPLGPADGFETGPKSPAKLSYQLEGYYSEAITKCLINFNIYIDRTAPGGSLLGELELPGVGADYVINPVDLDPIKGLLARVPTYGGQHAGDVIVPMISVADEANGDPIWIPLPSNSVTLPPGASEVTDVSIYFPAPDLLAQGDGPRKLGYFITDRAGNRSTVNGEPRPVTLLLSDVPTDPDLFAPVIPLYADSIIDEADARNLTVIIPKFAHANNGDSVDLFLDGVLVGTTIISDKNAEPILTFSITYAQVITASKGVSRFSSDFEYTVSRTGHQMASSPILRDVLFDITLPGGPDPDPETPEDEALLDPWILGKDGAVKNVIYAFQYGEPAQITVPWPPGAAANRWLKDDIIQITYGTLDLTPYRLSATDVANKTDLKFTLLGSQMSDEGTGTLKLKYTVARVFAAAGSLPEFTNVAKSKTVDVDVIGADEVPGGGNGLPSGRWVTLTDRGALTFENTRGGAEYEIKLDYINVSRGDKITLKLAGYKPRTNATPTPGTAYEVTSDPLTPTEIARGTYRFRVPQTYFTLTNLPRTHYLDHSHQIVNDAGGTGNTLPLPPTARTPVDLQNPTAGSNATSGTGTSGFSATSLDDGSHSQLKAHMKQLE
ncbi:hypothetical protein ASF66_16420 [Pseudomonas sp. Leaf129]|uniref:hypothetical protein n=1 Tax=Pseudomonas sp. Leaf129 TaxID=1736268 RepID=UPI000703045F|nr:hypothetical protein [Pseudomonas sp. Leaf129]KQQ57697.1 hypothetical protein ASF66_16420 [Pseudomonas sp. Leaf129]